MFKRLFSNYILKFILLILEPLFIVLSNIYGQSVMNRNIILDIGLLPVSIISIIICLLSNKEFYSYSLFVFIFLEIVSSFSVLFIILYHAFKEPAKQVRYVSAK
jgi:hypothetical protein